MSERPAWGLLVRSSCLAHQDALLRVQDALCLAYRRGGAGGRNLDSGGSALGLVRRRVALQQCPGQRENGVDTAKRAQHAWPARVDRLGEETALGVKGQRVDLVRG